MSYTVTIFKNINTTTAPFFRDVDVILNRIKTGASKELVKSIRKEQDKSKRNEIKKQLPSIVFSGQFNKRSDVSIIEHSGLICLDFDGYSKKEQLLKDKKKFCKNPYVYSCFVSPSGKGLKVIVRIPADPKNHVGYFNALEKHFNSKFFDTTSKNLSRVCYESYDPLIYINTKAKTWDKIEDLEYKEYNTDSVSKCIYFSHGF